MAEEYSIAWAEEKGLLKALETYRVKPEGMTLEEWYKTEWGEANPPASEIPSGPPSSWGAALEPVSVKSGGTDIPYDVVQPTIQTIETVADIMQSKGFVEGEYGGYYKPSTQETRPLSILQPALTIEQLSNTTSGNGAAGEGLFEGFGDIGTLLLALGAAMAFG